MKLRVLYEDNHLLVVEKPAGVATMGVSRGGESLLTQAKDYVKRKYNKPGNVYLGVVHRLDLVASGICVFARTSKAAKRLSAAFACREIDKQYLVLIPGRMDPAAGRLEDWLRKDERQHKMVRAKPADGKSATLDYQTLGTYTLGEHPRLASLLRVTLESGRKHQIRVQFALRRRPIVGDRKYGSRQSFPRGIALHASQLLLAHPVGRDMLKIQSPLPAYWPIQTPS